MLTVLATSSSLHLQVTSTSPWWSYVAPIASAFGTTAAFAVTYRLFHRGRQDRIQAQADRVFVKEERAERTDGGLTIQATVFNKSEGPIWRVEVKPLRAGAPYDSDGVPQPLPDLWPDESHSWDWSVDPEDAPAEDRHPRLAFTDATDRRWHKIGPASKLVSKQRLRDVLRRS